MHTIPRLNLPEVWVTQTHKQSSTNEGDYKKKASNRSIEHCGVCKATRIKSFLISQTLHREIRKHKERRGSFVLGTLTFRSQQTIGQEDTSKVKVDFGDF